MFCLRKLKKGYFTYDYEKMYEGYYLDSEKWNGWYVPYFEKNVALKIAKDLNNEFFKSYFDKDSDSFVIIDKMYIDDKNKNQDKNEYTSFYPAYTETYNNQKIKVYSIGGWAIAWNLKELKKDSNEIEKEFRI